MHTHLKILLNTYLLIMIYLYIFLITTVLDLIKSYNALKV